MRWITLLVAAAALVPAAPAPARAYDVEAHYVWTYYLALHAGFTPRQAFQIASATVGIDGDRDTEPLEGVGPHHLIFGASADEAFALYSVGPVSMAPNHRIVNVWSRLHAFAETNYVGSGRLLPTSAPSPAEVALVPNVQAVREENQRALATLAVAERNPGPLLHFVQDSFAHGPYDNLRGHGLHGHAPDFMSNRPSLAWQMTLRTLEALRNFLPHVGGTPRAPDMARIREVFDRMIEANPRRWVTDPTLYDTAFDRLVSDPARYVLDAQELIPNSSGVGSPSAAAAWRVVNRAVEEDRRFDRLPDFPEVWFNERPPPRWLQYDFLDDGRAASGGVNRNRYAVERVTVNLAEPSATFTPVSGSPNGAQRVTLRLSYTIDGLANLPFLRRLPVLERAVLSDYSEARWRRAERENGTFTIERTVQRSAASLRSGTLRWTVAVHPYGLEPVTRELTVRLTGTPEVAQAPPQPQPAAQCAVALGRWHWPIGIATFSGDATGGTASATGNPHVSSGTWRCIAPDLIEIRWNGGRYVDRMRVGSDTMAGNNQNGHSVRARREGSVSSGPSGAPPPAAPLAETCTWTPTSTFYPAACICRRSDGLSFQRARSHCGR